MCAYHSGIVARPEMVPFVLGSSVDNQVCICTAPFTAAALFPKGHFQIYGLDFCSWSLVQSLCSKNPALPALAATESGQQQPHWQSFLVSAHGSDGSKLVPTDFSCRSAVYLFGQWWNYYLSQILILIFKIHEPPRLSLDIKTLQKPLRLSYRKIRNLRTKWSLCHIVWI